MTSVSEWAKPLKPRPKNYIKQWIKRYILGLMDNSELDKLYFIDQHVYNCAFCKRRHVRYTVTNELEYDWDLKKTCWIYLVKCNSCGKKSMHLSFEELAYYDHPIYRFRANIKSIDNKLIYSRPTSFFTLDSSIDDEIRKHISEAEEALQFNLLTGASASLRKAIYMLVKKEGTIVVDEKTKRTKYKESIKGLKAKFPRVEEYLIDTLAEVQALASNPVHEDAWETWDNKHLRFLIELTKSILEEMYAEPEKHKKRKQELEALKTDLKPKEKGGDNEQKTI